MVKKEDYININMGVISILEYYARRGLSSDAKRLYHEFCSAISKDEKTVSYDNYKGVVKDTIKIFGLDDRIVKRLEEDLKLMEGKMDNGK